MHLILQLTQHQTELAEGLLIDLLAENHENVIEAYANRLHCCGVVCATFKDGRNRITIGIDKIKSTLTLVAPRHGLPHHCTYFMSNMGFFDSTGVLPFAQEVKTIHYLSRRTDVEWYKIKLS